MTSYDLRTSLLPLDQSAFTDWTPITEDMLVQGSLDPVPPGDTVTLVLDSLSGGVFIGQSNNFGVLAVDNEGNSGEVSDDVAVLVEDIFPPASISDLSASIVAGNLIRLEFTAPGDDEDIGTGTVYV